MYKISHQYILGYEKVFIIYHTVSIKQTNKSSFKISHLLECTFRSRRRYYDFFSIYSSMIDADRSKPTAPRRFRVETRSSRENREGNRSIGEGAARLWSGCCCYTVRHELVSRVVPGRESYRGSLAFPHCVTSGARYACLAVYRAIGVSPTTWKRNINLINRYSFDILAPLAYSVFRSGTKRTNFPLLYVETIRNDN